MAISNDELRKEEEYLDNTVKEIKSQISSIGQNLYQQEEKIQEFKKYLWDNKHGMDPVEVRASILENDLEVELLVMRGKYLRKLLRSQNSPYFGRIDFKEDNDAETIYLGITYVDQNDIHLVYDWRAPISSMFYDFGVGNAFYYAPKGKIEGYISKRRQYKIEDSKLIRVFDNDVNVVDDLLQEVLSSESTDKMKNIVNTIQQEQNEVIRDVTHKNLIVQGIAGSGKTSVALHRIAFLLYKIENLDSKDVLIFSPNNVFSEYISNVLPELGEDNVVSTTFSEFASSYIKGYKKVETFTNFVERFYKKNEPYEKLVRIKLSDEFRFVIDNYIKNLEHNINFVGDIDCKYKDYSKDELDDLLHDRYKTLPLVERIEHISEKICNYNEEKNIKKYISTLMNMLSIKLDYKELYKGIFRSIYFSNIYGRILTDSEINSFVNKDILNYEDSLLQIYMIGLIEGFPYNNRIKQVVIDEAQDYSYLQYFIIKKIFGNASFTILGDVNQTINPYYKYDSLSILEGLLSGKTKYLELTKTYRSSEEIINYTNKILGLQFVSAIRKKNNVPVIIKEEDNIKEQLTNNINELKDNYKSIAIITKTDTEAEYLYRLLDIKEMNLLKATSENFNRDLVIVPSYVSKGLEFDVVISYTDKNNKYTNDERYLYYVVCTRAQHELIIYNE